MDVLVRILRFEEQHLRDDEVGRRLVDGPDQEHDAFLQQARVDVVRALAASALLDHHRDQAQASRFFHGMSILGSGMFGASVSKADTTRRRMLH